MRNIEKYTKTIVASQPNPPRKCNWWFVIFNAPAENTIYGILFFMFILIAGEISFIIQPVRYITFYILLASILIFTSLLIYTYILVIVYRYLFGIMYGKSSTAHIMSIEYHTKNRKTTAYGICEVFINNILHEIPLKFNELDQQGDWAKQLKAGDHIHILLHPHKPIILVAFDIMGH